jgi:hypothetical protein
VWLTAEIHCGAHVQVLFADALRPIAQSIAEMMPASSSDTGDLDLRAQKAVDRCSPKAEMTNSVAGRAADFCAV